MMGRSVFCFVTFLFLFFSFTKAIDLRHGWGYNCEDMRCVKVQINSTNQNSVLSHAVCRLICPSTIGTVWPVPRERIEFIREVEKIDLTKIYFTNEGPLDFSEPDLWEMAKDRFVEMQLQKVPQKYPLIPGGAILAISFGLGSGSMNLDYDTPEDYELRIENRVTNEFAVGISASNFFGLRHALETLSQLIVYDELNHDVKMLRFVEIVDSPMFRHRGISMDTSRNYYPVEVIKRTINGLALNKLNSFHWHITDSQSFPMVVKSHPDFTKYGAYSSKKVYTADDIKDIVKFGRSRGVRVIPELDAPAHIGEGWQKKLHLTTCVGALPYLTYCWQPPCGHVNPIVDELYDVLEDIYREMMENFSPPAFHMGGDEIFFTCWNSSETLKSWMTQRGWGGVNKTKDDFLKLWGYFQDKALQRLDKVSDKKVPIILWTSELTEEPHLSEHLDKERYIIQMWGEKNDPHVKEILEKGYRVIISNHDALYMDCGFGSWSGNGLIWCSPYHEWQKVYQNTMEHFSNGTELLPLIWGAEATIWSESIDEHNIDSRLWPRVSALAERLWSNPVTHWRDAEPRLLMHRQYLVNVGGLAAERLQPEWCLHNSETCHLDDL